jgi:hypothetical protein
LRQGGESPCVLPVVFAVILSLNVVGLVYDRLTITRLKRRLDAYDHLLQLSHHPNDDGDGDGGGNPPSLRLIQGGLVAGTTALAFEWARQHPKASVLVALATVASALGLAASTPSTPHHPIPPVALPPTISTTPTTPTQPAPTSRPAAPSVTPPNQPPAAVPVNYLQRSPLPQRPPKPSPAPTGATPTRMRATTSTPPTSPETTPPGPPECSGIQLAVALLADTCLLG